MAILAYLRASTSEQDAARAKLSLLTLVERNQKTIDMWFQENHSGRKLDRPALMDLLAHSSRGDILLVEDVDRLTRLNSDDWQKLSSIIRSKGLRIVVEKLPITHQALIASDNDEFSSRMITAMSEMFIEMGAAMAARDYEIRRVRQQEGIKKAKAKGAYKGRPIDQELHKKIKRMLNAGMKLRETARIIGCSPDTVQRVKRIMAQASN